MLLPIELAIEHLDNAMSELRVYFGSIPLYAHELDFSFDDTEKTISEAKRLFETVNPPNLMIKVPATAAGIPAITELIASGVNVNVTLIFGLENYKAVAEAYIAGLEKLAQNQPSVKDGQAYQH